jgi:hypothetical protein
VPDINSLKAKVAAAKPVGKKSDLILDLSLADSGDIQTDTRYVGRIISARLIDLRNSGSERTSKIDVCIEILGDGEERLGVLNDYLHFSARSLRRLREFLLSAGLKAEANSKSLNAGELCEALPGRLVTLETRTDVPLSGNPRSETQIVVGSYIVLEPETETEAA